MLLIEVDGNDEETVRRNYETIGEMCLDNKAMEVYVADNHTTRERLWAVRRNIPDAYNNYSAYVSHEDIVVPPASIPRLIPEVEKIEKKYNVRIGCFGHAGDGNLHPQIIKGPDCPPEAWKEKLEDILVDFYKMTKRLGGTLSGEHGVGSKRKRFMKIFASEGELDIIRQIKRALDPHNIMNPGKIVD
jgi:glycolate oxidase